MRERKKVRASEREKKGKGQVRERKVRSHF